MDAGHIVSCLLGLLVARGAISPRGRRQRREGEKGGGKLSITQKHTLAVLPSITVVLSQPQIHT